MGVSVNHFMDQVDAAISENRPLAWIEEHVIDPTGLDQDRKSALWLYAWAMLPHADHRKETRAHLGGL
jgi:hypothetical protein